MNNYPLVTIGIPNYNYARYITDALNSAVSQEYENLEIIIVDDCSNDNSVEVIEKWIARFTGDIKITLIKNSTNVGIAKVCNIILSNASGKYYQLLDADDILLPGKIKKQVDLLEKNSSCAFVYSNISIINEAGIITEPDYLAVVGYDEKDMPQGNIFKELFHFNFIPNASVLINTAYAKDIGGYDETLQVQDYYLYLTLSSKYDVLYMQVVTAYYRIHSSSLSNTKRSNAKSIEGVLSLLYRYYPNGDAEIRKEVKRNIHYSAAYLYECKYPTASLWLKRDLFLNPGFKTLGYFLAIKIGLPFKFFATVKNIFQSNNK